MERNTAKALPTEEYKQKKQNLKLVVSNDGKISSPTWTLQEKAMIAVCAFVVLVFLIGTVATSVAISSANRNLALIQAKVDNTNNKNSNLKQEINELTSHTRLQKIANEYGLSLSNQNIRNVSK